VWPTDVTLCASYTSSSFLCVHAVCAAAAAAAQPEVAGEAKLNGLLALYSSCSTAPARYMVLLQTLEFAKQSKQLAALLVPVVKVRWEQLSRCCLYAFVFLAGTSW
jgi:hypothetical protein